MNERTMQNGLEVEIHYSPNLFLGKTSSFYVPIM